MWPFHKLALFFFLAWAYGETLSLYCLSVAVPILAVVPSTSYFRVRQVCVAYRPVCLPSSSDVQGISTPLFLFTNCCQWICANSLLTLVIQLFPVLDRLRSIYIYIYFGQSVIIRCVQGISSPFSYLSHILYCCQLILYFFPIPPKYASSRRWLLWSSCFRLEKVRVPFSWAPICFEEEPFLALTWCLESINPLLIFSFFKGASPRPCPCVEASGTEMATKLGRSYWCANPPRLRTNPHPPPSLHCL